MLTTRLTFAVLPRDGFAPGKGLTGGCQISLTGDGPAPVMNRSGHYCFIDLPAGEYTVITSTKYYLDQEVAVATALLDPQSPAITIDLEPNLAYFPPARPCSRAGSSIWRAAGSAARRWQSTPPAVASSAMKMGCSSFISRSWIRMKRGSDWRSARPASGIHIIMLRSEEE